MKPSKNKLKFLLSVKINDLLVFDKRRVYFQASQTIEEKPIKFWKNDTNQFLLKPEEKTTTALVLGIELAKDETQPFFYCLVILPDGSFVRGWVDGMMFAPRKLNTCE